MIERDNSIIPVLRVFRKPVLAMGPACLMGAPRTALVSTEEARAMPSLPPCPWTARVWAEFHADNLTRASRDVLLTLKTYRGHGGLCVPAHATLAARAGCCVRTVQRALYQARELGLVSWAERRMRAAWRWLRTSNAYHLEVPAEPVTSGSRPPQPRRATTRQNGAGGESPVSERGSQGRKGALAEFTLAAAALPDLLAARREVIQARLLTGWRG